MRKISFPTLPSPTAALVSPWVLVFAGVLACGSGDDDDVSDDALTTGKVTEDSEGHFANADTYRAFGFATNGIGVVYLAPNPEATCALVKEYLNFRGVYDPRRILVAQKCVMAMRFKYDDNVGFDGRTYTEADTTSFWNVNCAMGVGDWEITGEGNDRDYKYVGEDAYWWQGDASAFTTTITVGEDANTPIVEMELGPNFTGQFIVLSTVPRPATGEVTGTIQTERCPELVQTSLYGE